MSRFKKLWVLIAPMAVVLTMTAPIVGVAPASAAPGDPIIPATPSCTVTLVSGDPAIAPPPTCYDPSGSDLDEFLVPNVNDANGNHIAYEDGSWNPYNWDRPNSTNGASQVFVQSTHYDSTAGGYVNGPAWTLSFNTAITATPGPNTYWVSVGACKMGSQGLWVREATAYITNVAGSDGRYIGEVYPEATADGGGLTAIDTKPVKRIYDGATIGIPLITFDVQKPGLNPGYTYKVKFWLADQGPAGDPANTARRLGATLLVDVPKCGTSGTPITVKPTAKIVLLHKGRVYNRVKVVLGSRQATKATHYRVIINPKRGKTIRKSYTVSYKAVTYKKIRKGTVIKVRFGTRVVLRRF